MEETQEKKKEIRNQMASRIAALSPETLSAKTKAVENRLFEFANFLESRIALLYTPAPTEVDTSGIIRRSYMYHKIIVLPDYESTAQTMALMKVDDPEKDLITSPRGNLAPNPVRCKKVPKECIDIAVIPGLAMDEKGGRIGTGFGFYDRLIPELPITTRKVGLIFEDQIVSSVPMESHDKHVDIIITEDRVIYKI